MSKVTITFDTDNAAFVDDYDQEVRNILHRLGRALASYGVRDGESFEIPVRDTNGNTVGTCTIDRRAAYVPPTWADMLGQDV